MGSSADDSQSGRTWCHAGPAKKSVKMSVCGNEGGGGEVRRKD